MIVPDPQLLLMCGVAIGQIIVQKDLGVALLFFTIFLTILYLVTGRFSYAVAELPVFAIDASVS